MAMVDVQTIGLLTGGGDSPGINAAIRAVVEKAAAVGVRVTGVRDGWKGLMTLEPGALVPLAPGDVRDIDRVGGTTLGTSRTNPYRRPEGAAAVARRVADARLDALVVIGGADTLWVANRLHEESGIRVVGIPKTIACDVAVTTYTLGFESAVQAVTDAIDRLRTSAESHSRVFVVETMGRQAGHLALRGGVAGGADLVLIPEVPFEVDRVCSMLAELRASGRRSSMVVVAEGASATGGARSLVSAKTDEFGHKLLGGIGHDLAVEVEARTGIESRDLSLGHLLRGAEPTAYDRRMGTLFGVAAVEAVLAGRFGTMTALVAGRVRLVPLGEAVAAPRLVDVERDYDPLNYRPGRHVLFEGDY